MKELMFFLGVLCGAIASIFALCRKKTGKHKVNTIMQQLNEKGEYDCNIVYELQFEYTFFGFTYWVTEMLFYTKNELEDYLNKQANG